MSIYAYIATMAITTYMIRVLPLTVFRKSIKSRFVKFFLLCALCLPDGHDIPGHYV